MLHEISVDLQAVVAYARDVETDVLVIPVFEQDDLSDLPGADHDGELALTGAAGEFSGRLYDVHPVPLAGWKARRAALVGAGKREHWDIERLRRAAAAAALQLRPRRVERIAFVVRGLEPVRGAQAATEGLTAAEFSNGSYKTSEPDGRPARQLRIVAPGAVVSQIEDAVRRGRVIGESCNVSRSLCNEPGNVLTPRVFAERAAAIATDAGLDVEILDEHRIAELKMGLLRGVAQGSAEPPRVIVLRYAPANAEPGPVLGLVGKGITFDTGGISIKPADGMERMKDDMAGGAAVLCAMRAVALLKGTRRIVGVIPSTENMPGGRAFKPGDVLTSASGKTVEINNTDAEGRLVLSDGLWLAQQLGATHLVDVATLTGACVVALGKVYSGLLGTPEPWVQHIREAATRAGERCWPLPLHEDYFDQLKSEIADMLNSGGRPGGAITAAMFIKEFTGGLPWAHLDIAGTAWAEDARPYQPKGATGFAVRTLTELAFSAFPL